MKTLALVFLISICSGVNGVAQNRIHGWDLEKITAIHIEFTSPDGTSEIHDFNSKPELDAILSFLKEVDFRELDGNTSQVGEQAESRSCKIVFRGQRDQVYLYSNSACIGKTSFLINSNVIEDFRNLVDQLANLE